MRMKVLKKHRFNNRLVQPGEEYDIRAHDNPKLIQALGWAEPMGQTYKTRDMVAEPQASAPRRQRVPSFLQQAPVEEADADLGGLRSRYEELTGNKPDGRWRADRLKQEISEIG